MGLGLGLGAVVDLVVHLLGEVASRLVAIALQIGWGRVMARHGLGEAVHNIEDIDRGLGEAVQQDLQHGWVKLYLIFKSGSEFGESRFQIG